MNPNEDPKSGAAISETQAGAQTGGAQAGAGQAAQGAAAQTGTAQAGTGAAAQGALAQEETVSDVGQGEGAINTQSQTITQLNRLNQQLDAVLVDEQVRRARLATDYDQDIRALNLITLANAQGRANQQNTQIDHDSERARDNAATIDGGLNEIMLSQLRNDPVFQDAIAAKVAAKLKTA